MPFPSAQSPRLESNPGCKSLRDRFRFVRFVRYSALQLFNSAARAQSKNALGQAFLLLGKPNVARIDPLETDRHGRRRPVASRTSRDGQELAEGSGHHINGIFFNEPV